MSMPGSSPWWPKRTLRVSKPKSSARRLVPAIAEKWNTDSKVDGHRDVLIFINDNYGKRKKSKQPGQKPWSAEKRRAENPVEQTRAFNKMALLQRAAERAKQQEEMPMDGKVMYDFPDIESARKAYLSNYEDGWQGLGGITPVSQVDTPKITDRSFPCNRLHHAPV